MGRICRDDLRYTDDVIATLQADLPVGVVADLLNVSTRDVPYHRDEVHGMSHAGKVMSPPVRTKAPRVDEAVDYDRYRTGNVIAAMDREWLLVRTYRQIAEELGLSKDAVLQHCFRYRIITASSRPTTPTHVDKIISQPLSWMAVRTYRQISDELGVPYASVMDICGRRQIETRSRRAPGFQQDARSNRTPANKRHATTAIVMQQTPAWLSVRTYKQIADELSVPYDHVRIACCRQGIVTASTSKWSPLWKKSVTQKERLS